MDFRTLRKQKGYTQEMLGNILNVSPRSVRKWDRGALPTALEIQDIAKVFDEPVSFLLTNIFKPKDPFCDEKEMYKVLQELFIEVKSANQFLRMCGIYEYFGSGGVISYKNFLFPFSRTRYSSRTRNKKDINSIVLSDCNNNMVVFTENEIKNVIPVSNYYDIHTYEIVVCTPIFPAYDLEEEEIVRVSFYTREV